MLLYQNNPRVLWQYLEALGNDTRDCCMDLYGAGNTQDNVHMVDRDGVGNICSKFNEVQQIACLNIKRGMKTTTRMLALEIILIIHLMNIKILEEVIQCEIFVHNVIVKKISSFINIKVKYILISEFFLIYFLYKKSRCRKILSYQLFENVVSFYSFEGLNTNILNPGCLMHK